MTKRYLVTTAINDTKLHAGFWASVETWKKATKGAVHVVAGVYKNPTVKRSKAQRKKDITYATPLLPYLTRKDIQLGGGITLFGSMPVQPTASDVLAGLEVLTAGSSAIVGHPKRQLRTVPTNTRTPRLLTSTGSCTVASYSRSRAGARAARHHIIGALIVEVVGPYVMFVRHVAADAKGAFIDLDTRYTPNGVEKAPAPLSVTLGDVHVGRDSSDHTVAANALLTALKPQNVVLHDVYDGSTRSHHHQGYRDRYAARTGEVERECIQVAQWLTRWSSLHKDAQFHVVRSNHDEHLSRWLEEHDPKKDPINDPFYCRLRAACYDHFDEHGTWPNELELVCRQHGVDSVNFLDRNSSLVWCRVEHALHGDRSVNGSRGSLKSFAKMDSKVTVGHSHTPGIFDGVYQTGVLGKLDMGYNTKPTTWLPAHVVLHADGNRQLVITQRTAYRG